MRAGEGRGLTPLQFAEAGGGGREEGLQREILEALRTAGGEREAGKPSPAPKVGEPPVAEAGKKSVPSAADEPVPEAASEAGEQPPRLSPRKRAKPVKLELHPFPPKKKPRMGRPPKKSAKTPAKATKKTPKKARAPPEDADILEAIDEQERRPRTPPAPALTTEGLLHDAELYTEAFREAISVNACEC
jgi:hypothetical protein